MKQLLRIAIVLELILLQVYTGGSIAQVMLKPSLGLFSIPADGDSICPIPLAIDSGNIFIEPGLHEGDTIPDFKLYTLTGDSMQIGDLLTEGKPVLLVGGSYTCPKYRNHLDEVNDLQAAYGSQIHIYIIYTVEAHPDSPDVSPYRGNVWDLNSNEQLGINYLEPVTYLDRKNTVNDMLNNLSITVPVLLDGPCNEWWQTFALAPDPAFLIQPDGIIFKKQGWFDNGQYQLSKAIDSLLQGLPTGVQDVKQPFTVVNDPSLPAIQFIFPESQLNAHILLFDAMGRMIESSGSFSGKTFTMKKQEFIPGIYFYSIHSGSQVLNGKLSIQ